MADFVYSTVPGKIKPLLEKIRQVGVPQKATVQWLKTIGYTSSNDASLIGVLKAVELIDANGVPTPVWSNYRGTHHKQVLAEAIRKGYSELFAVYPDAWQRANSDLEHVFSTSSNAGKQVIAKTVGTFKAVCELADFGASDDQPTPTMHAGPMHSPLTQAPVPGASRGTITGNNAAPSVHIDVQIHISPEASTDQIDQIFRSMAKHLYGAKGDA
jgi:Family of unknown function (DUF5343)